MSSSIYLSALAAALHRHIKHTPINVPINKPMIKPIIMILLSKIYFSTAGNGYAKHSRCLLFSINRFGITLNFKLSLCRYLSSIPCDKEHIRRHCIIASLEFHHREDLPQPPSLVTTVLSRSTFDLTEVSLYLLPVIAVIEFAFQCLSPEDI